MTDRPATYPSRLTVNLTARQAEAIRQAAGLDGRSKANWARWHLLQQAEKALGLLDGELALDRGVAGERTTAETDDEENPK